MRKGAIALGALAVLGTTGVAAQSVESIMRARETLALTEEQIASLDVIRRELVEQRAAEMADMAELRSQLAAGQIRRSEVMAAEEERRDSAETRAEARRARIDAVLTEEQRASLADMRLRADRPRGGARRQGFAPGGRGGIGGGFGPGGGFGRRGFGPVGPRGPRGRVALFRGPRAFGPR